MTSEEVQLWTVIGGLATTLIAVLLTWFLTQRGERKRFEREESRRWQADRFRLVSEFLAWSVEVDRKVNDAAESYLHYCHIRDLPADKKGPNDTDVMEMALKAVNLLIGEWRVKLQGEGERMVHELELVVTRPVEEAAWWILGTHMQTIKSLERLAPVETVRSQLKQIAEGRDQLMVTAREMLSPPD